MIEPGIFFIQLPQLMGQLPGPGRFAGKQNKFHRSLADDVERAIVRPALLGGDLAIDRSKENQGRRLDPIHFEEWRFIDVELRIFERRLAEIIMIESFTKMDVAPIVEQ